MPPKPRGALNLLQLEFSPMLASSLEIAHNFVIDS